MAEGADHLIGTKPAEIFKSFQRIIAAPPPSGRPVPRWDGTIGERIADVLEPYLAGAI